MLSGQKPSFIFNWTIAGELPSNTSFERSLGYAGPLAGKDNNFLLVAGGANFPVAVPWLGGQKKYYREGFVFARLNDSFVYCKSFNLPYAVGYSASCTTPIGIVAAGGENEYGVINKVIFFHYSTLEKKIVVKYLPDLPLAVSNAAIAYHQGALYLAGGEASNFTSNRFFKLDLENLSFGWKELNPIPYNVSHTLLIEHGKGLFLIGGRNKKEGYLSDLYQSVSFFDFSTNEWTYKARLPHYLSAHSGILYGRDTILIIGGDDGKIFHELEELNILILKEKDEMKIQDLNKRKVQILTSHAGFSNELLIYNCVADKWTEAEHLPYLIPVTTTAVKWNNEIILPGGEIKPGIRSPELLLFSLGVRK
jgi:N-acetylneuraminate epimerase